MTLENVSTLPVDFLRLSFDDSTIAPAQQALADGDLSVFDTYETEYDLIHRPMFSWRAQKEFTSLGPGQTTSVTVTCFGKAGWSVSFVRFNHSLNLQTSTSGTIHVSYAYVHRPRGTQEKPLEVFHSRQLSYPVMVTVYHMLECHGMDIIPSPDYPISEVNDDYIAGTVVPQSISNVCGELGWCLFSVEVRNTYGLPFEVKFERLQEGLCFQLCH